MPNVQQTYNSIIHYITNKLNCQQRQYRQTFSVRKLFFNRSCCKQTYSPTKVSNIFLDARTYNLPCRTTRRDHMNYPIKTDSTHIGRIIFDDTSEQTVDSDFSLPDYCPDIQKILKCRIEPQITGSNIAAGTLLVLCAIRIRTCLLLLLPLRKLLQTQSYLPSGCFLLR